MSGICILPVFWLCACVALMDTLVGIFMDLMGSSRVWCRSWNFEG